MSTRSLNAQNKKKGGNIIRNKPTLSLTQGFIHTSPTHPQKDFEMYVFIAQKKERKVHQQA